MFNPVMLPYFAIACTFLMPVLIVIVVCIANYIGKKKGGKQNDPEDARIMQEIHQGLSRMNDRIDSLETILYDKKK